MRAIDSPQSPVPSEAATGSSSILSSNPNSLLLEQDDDPSNHHRRGPASSSPESGITNPSSFGSMSALLNNQHAQEQGGNLIVDEERNSAFDQGRNLARHAWLEMDAEVEVMHNNPSIEWSNRPVTFSSQRHISIDSCPTYLCARCGTTLALQDELISKAFSGRDGKAFLFFSILNAKVGPKEDRQLLTGLHTVADLSCVTCQRSVGWCYLRAFEASQRYKEGESHLLCRK